MKKSGEKETHYSSSVSTRSNRSHRSGEDDGLDSAQPPVRPRARAAPATARTGDGTSLDKPRNFQLVQNVTSPAPNLGLFSARPPDETTTSNIMEAQDDGKKSKQKSTGDDDQIGAFAVRGDIEEHRDIEQDAPTVSLLSGPATTDLQGGSTTVQHLAIAAEVADAQVHDEVRRALAGTSGADPEIHREIDAHVRRILAESAVPAANVAIAADEPSGGDLTGSSLGPPSMGQQKHSRNKKYWIIVLVLLAIVAIAVGVAVPLTTSNSGNEASKETPPVTENPGEPTPGVPPPSAPSSSPPSPTAAPTPAEPAWLQLGSDIEGVEGGQGGILGNSVSISRLGTIVAAGGPQSNFRGPSSGYVRISQYNTAASAWEQRGQLLNGTSFEFFGWSVSLSDDGNRVAASADGNDQARVFQYDSVGKKWDQLGENLIGDSVGDRHGSKVALSGDGTVLATAARGTAIDSTPGYIRVYRYNGAAWIRLGNDIIPPAPAGDIATGYSLSLSTAGGVLALGTDERPVGGTGVVQVFEYNDASDTWLQLGDDLRGLAAGDRFGFSTALSSLGSILAVGAPANNTLGSGYARVYEFGTSGWTQIMPDITGKFGDEFGSSVSLSDGGILAVGARLNSENGPFAGKAQVFEYNAIESNWVQIGQGIMGELAADEFGVSVSLSGDGRAIAVGGRFHDSAGGLDSGHVQVHNLVDFRRQF